MNGPQQRGGRVDDFVDRLSHPAPGRSSGAIMAALQCVISFGLLPLIIWPARWAEFVESERHDLLDLAMWWRRRVSPADAAQLDRITRKLRPRPILMVLPWLAAGFNVVLMIALLARGDDLNRLWELTFKHASTSPVYINHFLQIEGRGSWRISDDPMQGMNWVPATSPIEENLYTVWIATLCVGYGIHMFAVRSHARAVRSLVRWTNRIGSDNQFLRVRNDAMKPGIHPLWILLGFIMVVHHVWWAIPMVFAGALQRRYCMQSSPAIRIALAGQARDAFAVVQTGGGERFCPSGHCGARLPSPAKFCPRCGTAV